MTTREPTIEEYVPYGNPCIHICDYPGGCERQAKGGLLHPATQKIIYRCDDHQPQRLSDWRKAFQYGIPEVWARYPGVFFKSQTIRHPSGATLEARHHDSVFTNGEVSLVNTNDVEIDLSLAKYELEDWGWTIVVPGVLEKAPTHWFESGDPKFYTHCQACGESIEGQKAYWCSGQYHPGTCYDTLFANCLACGKHCMDARTNMSPRAHLRPIYAAQLCSDCLHKRWTDKSFRALVEHT